MPNAKLFSSLLDEKLLYASRRLTLYSQKIKLPNGYESDIDVIKHPGAALVIPFLESNKVILLRQLRPVINSYLYELPAGTRDNNESPLSCAKREIVEETGFSAKKFVFLGKIYPVPGYSTEEISIFKAEGLLKQGVCPEHDEIITSVTVNKPKVAALFRSGKILDAKTICAFAMVGWI